MARKLNPWIYVKLIFTVVPGISLVFYGIDVLRNGKVWDFVFGTIFKLINKYAPENQTIISITDKFFNIRFDPSDFWIGFIMISIGAVLSILGLILVIPDKYISLRTFNKFKDITSILKNRKIFNAIFLLILLSSVSYLFIDFNEPISRIHSFKQAEVSSNIYFYVNDGFTIEEYMLNKNEELKIFSYPFYQWSVAGLSIISGLGVEQSGRLLNIIIFIFTSLLFLKILNYLKVNELTTLLMLFLFAFSPLTLYFYRAVHPDPFAILFMFISIYNFIKYEDSNQHVNFIISILAGIIVCLIKSPTYLIGFGAIIFYRYYFHNFKGLIKRDFVVFTLSIVATVLFYKFSTDFINVGFYIPSEMTFGTLAQRFSLSPYLHLLLWNAFEVTNPIFLFLAIVGLIASIKTLNSLNDKTNALFIGLFIGWFISIFTFFHVFQRHDYYHLPIVIMTSYFIVQGISKIFEKIHNWKNFRSGYVFFSIILLIILTSFLALATLKLPTKPDKEVITAGRYFQNNLESNDFLFYIMSYDEQSWDPTYLFHTRRNGFNISLQNVKKENYIDSIITRHAKPFENIYLYAPIDFYLTDPQFFERYELFKEFDLGKIFKIK